MSVFANCPFQVIWEAFREMWPGVAVQIHGATPDDLSGAIGACVFLQCHADILISMDQTMGGACDTLCHELAHAAVDRDKDLGPDHHSLEWKQAYHSLCARVFELTRQRAEEEDLEVIFGPVERGGARGEKELDYE